MRTPRFGPRPCPSLVLAVGGTLTLLALASGTAGGQEEVRRKAGGPTAPLVRYVPREKLIFLFEFDGLGAHAVKWRGSAAYKILNETKLGPLLEDLLIQGLQAAVDSAPGANKPSGKQLVDVLEAIARDGFVVAAAGEAPQRTRVVLAVRGGSRGVVGGLLDLALKDAAGGQRTVPEEKAGRRVHRFSKGESGAVCLFEADDVVFTSADNVDAVVAVLDGRQPGAVDHPVRAELMKSDVGFEPIARGFLDFAALPAMPPPAVALGLDGLKRVDFRCGFQDDAILTVLDVIAPAPRRGVLTLFDQPTFDRSSLPPMPAAVTGFTVASVDLAKSFDVIVAIQAAGRPDAGPAAREPDIVRQVRRDLLPHLGPKIAFYMLPDPNAAGNALAAMLSPLGGLTLTLQTDDPAAVGRALGPLTESANRALKATKGLGGPRPAAAPAPQFRKDAGAPLRYTLDLPPGSVPPGPLATLRPTLIVGKSQVVVSAQPRSAEQALASADNEQGRWAATGAYEPMARRLPSGLIFLSVSDPRTTLPGLIAGLPNLVPFLNSVIAAQAGSRPGAEAPARPPFALKIDPDQVPAPEELGARLFPASIAVSVDRRGLHLVTRESVPSVASPATAGVLVGLFLPAVQAAREAARRVQCVNNLKQIGLAMHNHHEAHDSFPPAAITNKAGKPLLSWRVAILPFLEEKALYDRFHLDEPWDSPHNKALIASMPASFHCPSRPIRQEEPGMASYRVFTGATTAFPPRTSVKIAGVTDGTSNTVMAVETREGVPWTKPEELEFDPRADGAKPNFGAGSYHPGGFNALFLDGSVRFLKVTMALDVLRALITRAGGEDIKDGVGGR